MSMFIKGSKVTGTISIINIFAIWLYFGQNVPYYICYMCVKTFIFGTFVCSPRLKVQILQILFSPKIFASPP